MVCAALQAELGKLLSWHHVPSLWQPILPARFRPVKPLWAPAIEQLVNCLMPGQVNRCLQAAESRRTCSHTSCSPENSPHDRVMLVATFSRLSPVLFLVGGTACVPMANSVPSMQDDEGYGQILKELARTVAAAVRGKAIPVQNLFGFIDLAVPAMHSNIKFGRTAFTQVFGRLVLEAYMDADGMQGSLGLFLLPCTAYAKQQLGRPDEVHV